MQLVGTPVVGLITYQKFPGELEAQVKLLACGPNRQTTQRGPMRLSALGAQGSVETALPAFGNPSQIFLFFKSFHFEIIAACLWALWSSHPSTLVRAPSAATVVARVGVRPSLNLLLSFLM